MKKWKKVLLSVLAIIFALVVLGSLYFKKPEIAKQPARAVVQTNEISDLWMPENGRTVFLNRLLFLEGEMKRRLIRELEIEVKRYKSGGLNSVKNDIWLSYIGKQLKKANLPSDLIYLPVIESSMRPTIISGRGAGGYWQFMPVTASLYGLKVESYLDERFDPVKSTDAAIRHLNDLLNRFDDWTATLGGYNMDPAALTEAMKQERTINFYNLKTIPLETQRFPFRLLATKLIFENPEKYGFSKTQTDQENKYESWIIHKALIPIEGTVSIQRVIQDLEKAFPFWKSANFAEENPHILGNALPTGLYYFYVYDKRNGTS